MGKSTTTISLDKLPEALRLKVAEIQPVVASLSDSNIRKRFEIGKVLLEVEQDNSGRYGDNPIKRMQQVMPLSRDGLRPMLELAKRYDDADIAQFAKLCHPVTGEHLNYSHVMALTRVKDKTRVFKLAEQTVEGGWTSKELNREIIRTQGGPRSKGGRKQSKPDSFPAAVTDVATKLQTIENAVDQVWTAPGGLADLYETLAQTPGWRPDQAIADAIDASTTRLMSVNMKLTGLLQLLSNLKHRVDAARKVQSAA